MKSTTAPICPQCEVRCRSNKGNGQYRPLCDVCRGRDPIPRQQIADYSEAITQGVYDAFKVYIPYSDDILQTISSAVYEAFTDAIKGGYLKLPSENTEEGD